MTKLPGPLASNYGMDEHCGSGGEPTLWKPQRVGQPLEKGGPARRRAVGVRENWSSTDLPWASQV